MITTEQSVQIDTSIAEVWHYVQDIRRWATLFPGCRECTVINDQDSHWVLKVGAGGLVRTVNVLVHVDKWAGPQQVDFSFRLDGDPVEGGGAYIATSTGPHSTDVNLTVRVAGTGPMAPMWEAMSRPLLPQLAKSFATQLKIAIEQAAPQTTTAPPVKAATPTLLAAIHLWLRRLCRSVFGARNAD